MEEPREYEEQRYNSSSSDESYFSSEEMVISDTEYFEVDSYLDNRCFTLTWTIENFSYVSTEPGTRLKTRKFTCGFTDWVLQLDPNRQYAEGELWIGILLSSVNLQYTKKVRCKFCLKNKNGVECFVKRTRIAFIPREVAEIYLPLTKRNKLHESKVLINDILTVYFEMTVIGASVHTMKKLDEITVKKDPRSMVDYRILGVKLGSIYKDKKFCDVVLKTQEAEFPVHKAVLAAHSEVFAAMFQHCMTEKSRNAVEITDIETSVLGSFLEFLYTGRLEHLTSQKVCGLLQVADKYGVEDLRNKCVEFLTLDVSLDTFFDLVVLASIYDEPTIKDTVYTFFAKNVAEVILTKKWDLLELERPDLADEIKNSYLFEL